VRGDLADVRLADRVFAPHYAAPMQRLLGSDTALRLARVRDSEVVAQLHAGDVFEVLELSGGSAWGTAPGAGLVGYIDAAAVSDSAP
jgi:hypothetical protein